MDRFTQVAGEDRPECLFQDVGPPEVASSPLQLGQRERPVVSEIGRVLQQGPAGSLKPVGSVLVGEFPEVLPGPDRRTFSSA